MSVRSSLNEVIPEADDERIDDEESVQRAAV